MRSDPGVTTDQPAALDGRLTVAIVAAIGTNGVIGRNGGLPWHLPEDLPRVKRITMGHVLLMGRRTYESIGRALPGRTTVVVTRTPGWSADGVLVAASIEDALTLASGIDSQLFVFGGSAVFAATLPLADHMYLTHVDAAPDGDTYFPDVDWSAWTEVARDARDGFAFVEYARSARGGDCMAPQRAQD